MENTDRPRRTKEDADRPRRTKEYTDRPRVEYCRKQKTNTARPIEEEE